MKGGEMRPGFENRISNHLTKSGVPALYHKAQLSDFPEGTLYDDDLTSGLFIFGSIGCGKTHMAVALIVNDIIKGVTGRQFVTMAGLLSQIKATYSAGSHETESQVVDRYALTPNLFIDDIGVEKVSDWVLDIVYQIFNYRYNNNLRTVITSNLTLDLLNDRLGERITSRIKGMTTSIRLTGKDRRAM